MEKRNKEKWYTRPVFSVSDIDKALKHYCEILGFNQAWAYEEEGKTIVAQVNKGELELILASNLDRARTGRVFISLEKMEKLKEINDRGIEVDHIHWGYPSIRIGDPDGNEMAFPQELDD